MIGRTIFILLLISSISYGQVFIVDQAAVNARQKERTERIILKVQGKAINVSGEKDGQLSLYVRMCGFILLAKNSKGDAPKTGQTIRATIKERCKIADWE